MIHCNYKYRSLKKETHSISEQLKRQTILLILWSTAIIRRDHSLGIHARFSEKLILLPPDVYIYIFVSVGKLC